MTNPKGNWCFWGVSAKKKYNMHSCGDETVMGIDASHIFLPFNCNNNDALFDPSTFRNCEIDMYLDLDANEFRMCIVGKQEGGEPDADEAIWYNISSNNKLGWVPHFNFSYDVVETQKIQIATIPVSFYGKKTKIQWNSDRLTNLNCTRKSRDRNRKHRY